MIVRPRSLTRTSLLLVLGLLPQLGFAAPAFAADGDRDGSFGNHGRVIGPVDFSGNAVAFQDDGAIVVAGSEPNDLGHPAFGVARFDAEGNLDPTFGGDGTVATVLRSGPRCFEYATDVVVQSDGRIVAVGPSYCGRSKFALVRYETDGTLDPTFHGDGTVLTNFRDPLCSSAEAEAAAIQADGKIVAAGHWQCFDEASGLRSGFAVARYDTDGSLDRTFGGDGRVITAFGPANDRDAASGVAVQPDGRIVVVGRAASDTDDERFAVARYRTHGRLDTSFGGTGKVTTSFKSHLCGARAHPDGMALQADGKIVAAGVAYCAATAGGASHPRWALARYDPDGDLDRSFGTDGRVITIFHRNSCGDEAYGGVAIQGGKVVAAGTSGCFSRFRFTLARYGRRGNLDTAFGGDGSVTTTFESASNCTEQASAVVVQPDRRIVAVGSSDCLDPSGFVMARYLPA